MDMRFAIENWTYAKLLKMAIKMLRYIYRREATRYFGTYIMLRRTRRIWTYTRIFEEKTKRMPMMTLFVYFIEIKMFTIAIYENKNNFIKTT